MQWNKEVFGDVKGKKKTKKFFMDVIIRSD